MNRWDTGPGRLTCDGCGYGFDPLATDWLCPHCRMAWPWRFIRRLPAASSPANTLPVRKITNFRPVTEDVLTS